MRGTKNQLNLLQGQQSFDVRQGWHHYRCPFCEDRSHHLGIHWESGRVRCLRCGYKTKLGGTGRHSTVTREPIQTGIDLASIYDRQGDSNSWSDSQVRDYAMDREIGGTAYGWAYGRKDLIGNLIFPAMSQANRPVYLQYQGSQTRWRSWGSNEPRLDFYPVIMQRYSPKTLVLNEGPIDAIRVRKHTGLWASPTFGIDAGRNRKFIADIVRYGEIKQILVWFDAEPRAEVMGNKLVRVLKHETDAKVIPVSWPSYSEEDQGDSTKSRILDVLGDYI